MASKKPVSVGVVGTSWWADAMHLPALAAHPGAAVVAVCGRDRDNAEKIARRWSIPHVYTDYSEMIASGLLDAVVISTPNNTHHSFATQALEAGLHVLCEKPLALDYAGAKEMADLARQKGLKALTPFTYRFMPSSRYIKQLIDEGYIGRPYHLNMRYYTGYARDGAYYWRFDLEQAGSGVVGDLGPHFLYLARWYYGPITHVTCELGHIVERVPTRPDGSPYEIGDDMAMITVRFASGAYGSIHVTAVCYEDTPFGQTHHWEFHGSGGTLYAFNDWDRVQRVSGARVGEGPIKELPIPDALWGQARRDTVHNTYRDVFRLEDYMVRGFITAILEDKAAEPDFDDGAEIQRLVDAAVLSHREGRRVAVEEIGG